MRLPLVVLAVLAVARRRARPALGAHRRPGRAGSARSSPRTLYHPTEQRPAEWVLAVVDAVVALVGLGIAWRLWRAGSTSPELEPMFLAARSGTSTTSTTPSSAGPARPSPGSPRRSSTTGSSTARSTASAPLVPAAAARRSRRVQTGYVRKYALGIVLGLGRAPRLHGLEGVVVVSHSPAFPFLTVLVLLPAAGAAGRAPCWSSARRAG